jgi:hypothetical protein
MLFTTFITYPENMHKLTWCFIATLLAGGLYGQTLRFSGNVSDTALKKGMPNVLLMVQRLADSSLVGYSRTDHNGKLKSLVVPKDTYIVVLSHPAFSDKTYLIIPSGNDSSYILKNVVLPPKSMALKEVEVIAYREKSFYKGDTLVFVADSFKTRANATVEDLLKRLPGFRVDAAGKITVQGKEIDQVLVDGDEFFGGDPTVATRNLNAASIENVQVYDKKNESTDENKEETVKVVNLKLKEDAKKGYFGKVSAASDFKDYYENDLLANLFRGNRKISVFGLFANTPKQTFNWNEVEKYGLTGEQPWSFNEESGMWSNNADERVGVPRTLKTGMYFSDQFGKKTKLNADYTLNENRLATSSEKKIQYFLEDTSFTTTQAISSTASNLQHAFNFRLKQKLDSLTELTVAPKGKFSVTDNSSLQNDGFISGEGVTTRETSIQNNNHNELKDGSAHLMLVRNFKKKDRTLTVNYNPSFVSNSSDANLTTSFTYYQNQLPNSKLQQRRSQQQEKREHNTSFVFVEPWTKKFKTELSYMFVNNQSNSSRSTFDIGGTSDIFNQAQSNNFDNVRMINRGGLKLIYDVKKFRISAGSYYRHVEQYNTNLTNGKKLSLTVDNILPNASFLYRISQGSNFRFNYITSSQQPDVQQMQPVTDNTDPNRLNIGNPSLRPTFNHRADINYNFYKGISEIYFWSGANMNFTNDQISYKTDYDSLGRAVTTPTNINGNYYGNMWLGYGHPVFKKLFVVILNLNSGINNNVSYVNGLKNISQNINIGPRIQVEKETEKFEFELAFDYDYNIPKVNISALSNQPYYSYNITGNFNVKLPKKFEIAADGNYTDNGNRTAGYNLTYFILNASVSKSFFKSESLVLSIHGNDIFNQNINNQRQVSSNMITDTKTSIIRRYFLLKLLYKFNSQKQKEDEDDD